MPLRWVVRSLSRRRSRLQPGAMPNARKWLQCSAIWEGKRNHATGRDRSDPARWTCDCLVLERRSPSLRALMAPPLSAKATTCESNHRVGTTFSEGRSGI
jgi:hypothetical protein